jgi:acyl-CoA hydrolase/RimJ/RimL family protein N-acetyltransferase
MDNKWQEKWAEKIASPKGAVKKIRSGQRIFIGSGCGVPQALVKALVKRANNLADVEILHLLSVGDAPYVEKKVREKFPVNTLFIADNIRSMVQEGVGDYTPVFLSDVPELFSSGQILLDVALVHVTPPDNNGFVSLGVSVNVTKSAIEHADLVIAQINPLMPRTLGGALIAIEALDILVPYEEPIFEIPSQEPSKIHKLIGIQVAALVESGSTIEVGIGQASQAVLPYLKEKRNLGIHTELISDSVLPLIESGAINGINKKVDQGKIVASFAMGTRRLYDAIDNNPAFSFEVTEHVNNPAIISLQPQMIAINTALEVDLSGQVCADSLGENFYSGLGGLMDFNVGASHSEGGKSIIVLPSTAKKGKVSRISAHLGPGSGVAITRGGVHYVVTEFGAAYLHGKSIQERAIALIGIAHPDFRSQLMKGAIKSGYLKKEMAEIEGRFFVGPSSLKSIMALNDGPAITFRTSHPSDKTAIKEMLYSLSDDSIYKRFISHVKQFPFQQIKKFLYIDHRSDEVIVGTIPKKKSGSKIVAVGGYYLDPKTNRAEVAFVVRDEWQGRGIGKYMLRLLTTMAKGHGLRGFTAETMVNNMLMRRVFENSGLSVKTTFEDGMIFFQMDFKQNI